MFTNLALTNWDCRAPPWRSGATEKSRGFDTKTRVVDSGAATGWINRRSLFFTNISGDIPFSNDNTYIYIIYIHVYAYVHVYVNSKHNLYH